MRRGLVLAVLLLASLTPMAGAAGDHASIGGTEVEGASWSVLSFEDDGHLRVKVTAMANDLPVQLGVDLVRADGRSLFVGSATFDEEGDGHRVEAGVGPAQAVTVHTESSRFDRIRTSYTVHLRGFEVREPRMVTWSAGDIRGTTVELETGTEGRLENTRTGSDTFLAIDDRFEGPLEAETQGPVLRSQVGAKHSVNVDHSLIGTFDGGQGSWDMMRAQGPDETRRCPCSFGDADDLAAGPGAFEFEATGIGTGPDRYFAVGGADVPFGR